MAYESNILLGRITKVSGYEGAVAVKLEKVFTENIPHMESVLLEIEGRPVPFFISDSDYSGADILKLSFDGYESSEKISEFIGCRVFLTSQSAEKIMQLPDNQILTGYAVHSATGVMVGVITDIISNNGQWLLDIDSPGKKHILIPFHEDLIVNINKKKKLIEMDIPDGLLDIN
jgi:16S rRNA processing protein RimM